MGPELAGRRKSSELSFASTHEKGVGRGEPHNFSYPWQLSQSLCDLPLLKSISYGHGTFCRAHRQRAFIISKRSQGDLEQGMP